MRPLLLAFVASLLACSGPTEVRIRSNATWSTDGSAVLLVETRYETNAPDAPWFYSPNATGWRTVFLKAHADLSNATELATFSEGDVGQGGDIQAAPLYWLEPQNVVVGLVGHVATAFRLDTRKQSEFVLPDSEKTRLFDRSPLDLRDAVTPVAVVPSPDATRVAVFHTAAYFGENVLDDLLFVHAMAIHKLDGTFERAVALSAWDDTEEDLQLDLPAPTPELPSGEPGASSWGLVPVHYNTRMLWTEDSSGLYVVDVDRHDGPLKALAWLIDANDGTHTEVSEVPERALPTHGGGVSPSGRLLAVFRSETAPNTDAVRLHSLTDWVPFDKLGTVASTEADYAR